MTDTPDETTQARRAELRRTYEERTKEAGVFQVRNAKNGRVLLASGLDLHGPLNRVAFELDSKGCRHPELVNDLKTFERGDFVIEVLEMVVPKDDPDFDPRKELEILEQKYLASLDRTTAYNRDDRIRYP